MRAIFLWGGDIGLLAEIASTPSLTADAVTCSSLQEERGRGFGGDTHGGWMVLWDLMIGIV